MSSAKSPYYVTEKDLWTDVMELYSDNSFPDRLAKNILKMSQRIVNAKRWDSCSDILREEMVSRASTHACLKLWERKFNPKKGSKVYSWLSRVIINECLKACEAEQRERKLYADFAAEFAVLNDVERIRKSEIDDN